MYMYSSVYVGPVQKPHCSFSLDTAHRICRVHFLYIFSQGRAKLMYNAGFRTLSTIASADPEGLVRAVEHLPRKVAKQIVASAKVGQLCYLN